MPKPPIQIDITPPQKAILSTLEQLEALSLPPNKRRRLTMNMTREVRRLSRINLKGQNTVDGSLMEPRKRRKRRKMLLGLGKTMEVFSRSETQGVVGWGNHLRASIAYRQQHGTSEHWTAAKARKVYGVQNGTKKATTAQAKALLKEGYKLRVRKSRGKGCRLVRVSRAWIRSNLSMRQAGLVLRLMRTGSRRGKQSWDVTPAARPFLGVKSSQANDKF